MLVKELMRSNVHCVPSTAPARQAALMMSEADCGALPVTSLDGTLLGMVTDRDILLAAAREDVALSEISVEQAMSEEVFSCQGEDDIHVLEGIMCRNQVRRVPVTDAGGKVIGIVSLADLARVQSAAPTHDARPDRQVVAATLQAIVTPSGGAPSKGRNASAQAAEQRP